MQAAPQSCLIENYIIKPSRIHFLRFILEAYEGIATMSTRDSSLGWVQLNIAPGCQEMVAAILDHESEWLGLRSMAVSS